MKKVIVIGCSGSGKTTFAEALSKKSGLPLFYLDAIWHRAGRTHISREEFDWRLGEILAEETWILDGHYSRTLERRLAACDTVFFLDYPVEVCLSGVRARRGKPRVDMPWIETEEDEAFMETIRTFPQQQRPQILALLERYSEKQTVIFTDRAQAEEYLRESAPCFRDALEKTAKL